MSERLTIGGHEIRLFPVPPESFRPTEAGERELLARGFPRRPDEKAFPQLFQAWTRLVTRAPRYIVPEFSVEPAPKRPRRSKSDLKAGPPFTDPNWSGSLASAPEGQQFEWIGAQWNIPNVFPEGNEGTCTMASWIGIDLSDDILQGGVLQSVGGSKGSPSGRECYAWWEWYPNDLVKINNFPVSPGDIVNYLICATSPTEATFYITNDNSQQSTSFAISAPKGIVLVGETAEWIVEAVFANKDGNDSKLPFFNRIWWSAAYAATRGLQALVTANDGQMLAIGDKGENLAVGVPGEGESFQILALPE